MRPRRVWFYGGVNSSNGRVTTLKEALGALKEASTGRRKRRCSMQGPTAPDEAAEAPKGRRQKGSLGSDE